MGSSRIRDKSSACSSKRANGSLHRIEEGAIQEQGQYPVEILTENTIFIQVRDMAAKHLMGAEDSPAGPERLQEIQTLGGAEEFQGQD